MRVQSRDVRVLFASTQGAGHFGPLIPFIDACLRNGHEALVVGPPGLDARGYEFRAGAVAAGRAPRSAVGPLPSLPPGQGDLVVVGRSSRRSTSTRCSRRSMQTIEEWKPDLVFARPRSSRRRSRPSGRGSAMCASRAGIALIEEASLAIAGPALEERQPGIRRRIADSPYLSCFPARSIPRRSP